MDLEIGNLRKQIIASIGDLSEIRILSLKETNALRESIEECKQRITQLEEERWKELKKKQALEADIADIEIHLKTSNKAKREIEERIDELYKFTDQKIVEQDTEVDIRTKDHLNAITQRDTLQQDVDQLRVKHNSCLQEIERLRSELEQVSTFYENSLISIEEELVKPFDLQMGDEGALQP